MEEKTLKPRIRFKGFTEAWEQRKFDDVISRVATGLNPRDNFALNTGGKNYYVTIKNFEHGHLYLDDNCDKVDDSALAKIQARSDLQINDVLFTSIGRIGDCYLIEKQPKNWNINESVFTFRPNVKEVTPLYLFHVIHSDLVLSKILNDVTGSTFKSIKIGDLKKLDIPITSQPEQEILSKFISDLDSLITLHQRNENYNYKRGFEKSSRFSFSWEQHKLGDIGIFTSNGVDKLSKPNEFLVNLLNYMDIYNRRKINKKNCSELMQVTAKPIQLKNNNVLAGDIYFTPTSETADDIGHVMVIEENLDNTVYSYHLMRYRPYENVFYLTYPNYGFDTAGFHRQMEFKAKGVQRYVISKPDFESLQVIMPKIDEQRKIAEMLTNLDSLITLHQREYFLQCVSNM